MPDAVPTPPGGPHLRTKARYLVENFFAKLKQVWATATRYKTGRNFLAGIHLAATATWLT